MANDRLMLKCDECGDTFTLAKYWGGGELQAPAALSCEGQKQAAEPFDAWATRHLRDCLGVSGSCFDGLPPRFVVCVEGQA